MIKVLDSRKINQGKPITFQQGNFQVVKCWDLSTILLHSNEKIRISCPAYLSNGGAEQYSHFSSQKIPADTPLTYDLEILDCQPNLKDIQRANIDLNAVGIKTLDTNRNVVHSGLKDWEGDDLHDNQGRVRREGGGPAHDYAGEVEKAIKDAKPNIDKLKKVVDKEKAEVEKDSKDVENDQTKTKDISQATKVVQKEDKIIQESIVVEQKEKSIQKIESKLSDAENTSNSATSKKQEQTAVKKVEEAKNEVTKQTKEITKSKTQLIKENN